jgi:hypothetical protein
VAPQIDAIRIHGIPAPNAQVNYKETYNKIPVNNMFIDQDFSTENCGLPNVHAWKRPCEICDDPQFVVDDVDMDDINQGYVFRFHFLPVIVPLEIATYLLV